MNNRRLHSNGAIARVALLVLATTFAGASLPIALQRGPRAEPALVRVTRVSPRVARATPLVHRARPVVRGKITEFTVPSPNTEPAGMTAGPSDTLWFVENVGNRIVEFDIRSSTFLEYRIPTRNSAPVRVAADGAGNLWFTESNPGQIGEFTIATRTFHEYPIPTPGSSPFEVIVSDTGVWFTEETGGRIGNLSNGTVTEYVIPTRPSEPLGILPGAAGTMWFRGVLRAQGRKVGHALQHYHGVSRPERRQAVRTRAWPERHPVVHG
jgi:streptogramin lyase